MGQGRAFARFLSGAPLLFFLAAAGDVALPIREARWLTPGAVFEGLTLKPAECLAPPASEAERRAVAIGRTAFHAPLLLGGQAARAGLSCASCHANGRGNRHFSFPGLSGAAGTADVTSSLMSKKRGDGSVNPKPIPDLAAPPATHIASRDPASGALERFIHGLIVEEFDGPEPPPAVLAGVAAYVRAIRPGACKGAGKARVTLDGQLGDIEAGFGIAIETLRGGDGESARLLLGSVRSMLGTVDERFGVAGMDAERRTLRAADVALRDIQSGILAGEDVGPLVRSWQAHWRGQRAVLERAAARSLYAPKVLRRHLSQGRHPGEGRDP